MAKKGGSGKHYTSKGERAANRSISNEVRRDRSLADKSLNKFNAFLKGKRVWFTIDNPNPNETNKRKIRVLGENLYGDFRSFQRIKLFS